MGVEDDQAASGSPSRKSFSGRLERLGQGLLPGLIDPEPGQEVEDARVAPHVVGELVVPAVGEVTAGSRRAAGSLILRFMETQAISFHSPVSGVQEQLPVLAPGAVERAWCR